MVSIVASVWCSAKPRPHGAGGADTLYHPLHQCYTKYYVILFAKIRPTTMETQYHMKREMSDITGLQYTRLNTIDRPFSISFYELFLQTSGDCNNLPKISFNQSIILFCFNGARPQEVDTARCQHRICVGAKRQHIRLAHGAGGADTPYHPLHQCYTKYCVILSV
jgi:hypothetical protein